MTLTRVALVLVLLLPACDGPTEVVEFGQLEGLWQFALRDNTSCSSNALARIINFSLDTFNIGDGVDRFQGVWDPNAPLVVGAGYSGEFDPGTRQVTMTFVHTGTGRVIVFEGTVTRNDRMSGTIVPPPVGSEPYWDVGSCEQSVTGRKVQEHPVP